MLVRACKPKTINNVQQAKIKQKEIINEVENGNVKLKTNKQKVIMEK